MGLYRWFAILLLAIAMDPATAQGPNAGGLAKAAINVSELCTTCDDVIRCTVAAGASAPVATVTVYHLHKKSFWGQVATIWDYFIQIWKPQTSDERVLTIFDLTSADAMPSRVQDGLEAMLDANAMTITVPGAVISRTTGNWTLADGTTLGRCELLRPAAAGYRLLNRLKGLAP
jgi:hypothetical protein